MKKKRKKNEEKERERVKKRNWKVDEGGRLGEEENLG